MRDLLLQRVEQLFLRLFGRHAGNALEPTAHLDLSFVELVLTLVELTLHRAHLLLALVERVRALVERLLTLLHTVLGFANFRLAFLALLLDLGPQLQRLVFCLDFRFPLDRLRLPLRIRHDGLGLGLLLLG